MHANNVALTYNSILFGGMIGSSVVRAAAVGIEVMAIFLVVKKSAI
jgi:hypothetical protein